MEKDFRKKNLWYSFTGALYGAIGGAAFFGLLATVAQALVKVAAGAVKEGAIFGPVPLLVMGGLMAVGTLCVYMSQREYTELRCLGDQHLAYQNAKQLSSRQEVGQAQTVEHVQNCRADGKKWVQALRPSEHTTPARVQT